MVQRKNLARQALAVLALALLAALPALAGAPAAPAPTATPPSGCPAGVSLLGDLAPSAPSAALPAWLDLGAKASATTVFHGYCRCTCSRTPDCNTDADCSNHRCLGGISCC